MRATSRRPQDIEWCLVDDELQIVQSRPITTLFPIAALKRDIRTKPGTALFDFILADIQELKRFLFDQHSLPADHGGDGGYLVAQ